MQMLMGNERGQRWGVAGAVNWSDGRIAAVSLYTGVNDLWHKAIETPYVCLPGALLSIHLAASYLECAQESSPLIHKGQ
jgi:hypothetical protein